MKPPRKLYEYVSAEEAALGLEELARDIRAAGLRRPMVKWFIRLSFWNPVWQNSKENIMVGIDYSSRPKCLTT